METTVLIHKEINARLNIVSRDVIVEGGYAIFKKKIVKVYSVNKEGVIIKTGSLFNKFKLIDIKLLKPINFAAFDNKGNVIGIILDYEVASKKLDDMSLNTIKTTNIRVIGSQQEKLKPLKDNDEIKVVNVELNSQLIWAKEREGYIVLARHPDYVVRIKANNGWSTIKLLRKNIRSKVEEPIPVFKLVDKGYLQHNTKVVM